jgi:hypothetical protein
MTKLLFDFHNWNQTQLSIPCSKSKAKMRLIFHLDHNTMVTNFYLLHTNHQSINCLFQTFPILITQPRCTLFATLQQNSTTSILKFLALFNKLHTKSFKIHQLQFHKLDHVTCLQAKPFLSYISTICTWTVLA